MTLHISTVREGVLEYTTCRKDMINITISTIQYYEILRSANNGYTSLKLVLISHLFRQQYKTYKLNNNHYNQTLICRLDCHNM